MNQVFNIIQEQKRQQRRRPIAMARNAIIALGAAVATLMLLSGVLGRAENQQAAQQCGAKAAAPVMLNTAKPPVAPALRLGRPVSIEQPFGRTMLTGVYVESVPRDPLDSLAIERAYDGGGVPTAFRPPADLPPQAASDEVKEEPKHPGQLPPTVDEDEFSALGSEVREHVTAAQGFHRQARQLMSAVEPNHPKWSEKQGQAAALLIKARDEVTEALRLAADVPALLDLMQEIKADLYSANKHRLR